MGDGVGLKEDVAAHVAHFGGNVVNNDDLPAMAQGVQNAALLVGFRTALDRAFHA